MDLTEERLKLADMVVLLTDHDAFDYEMIEKNATCILDTRNAFGQRGIRSSKIRRA